MEYRKQLHGFDAHGSVHLGNMFYSSPTRCTPYSLLFLTLALHVSCAICTDHQEHKLQSSAIGFVWFGVLLHWSRYWFGTALHLSTVSYSQTAIVLLMMGANSTRSM
jgi:hypothetical protein